MRLHHEVNEIINTAYGYRKDKSNVNTRNEVKMPLNNNGDLDMKKLEKIRQELQTAGVRTNNRRNIHRSADTHGRAIDPSNYRPFHVYKEGVVEAGDAIRLTTVRD